MSIILTDENFEQEVSGTEKMFLVDFYASWCGPCNAISPILEKAAESHKEELVLGKLNVDESPNTAQKYKAERLPTVVLFKWGFPITGFIGVKPEHLVEEWLEQGKEIIIKVEKDIEGIIKNYENYAKNSGFKLNPDKKEVRKIILGLLQNEKKYGKRYCPCRRITGDTKEDILKICPCKWHKEEIERDGKCFCGLFVK